MRIYKPVTILAVVVCLMTFAAVGQQPAPPEAAKEAPKSVDPTHFYRLEFVVKELDQGKLLNQRSYTMGIAASGATERRDWWSLRAGTKVAARNQYVDVGFNVDVRGDEVGNGTLQLRIKADLSSIPPDVPSGDAMPPIRQMRIEEAVLIPLNHPTAVFAGEDPASRHQFQLEVTAVPQR